MPVTSPQGTLDFKKVDKITFVGASSNTVIDTTTGSVGIGVVGDALSSNLHVVGDTRMEGNINMLHTSNTASIKLNSNVVTEFPRSKKLIKYPRVALTDNSSGGYVVGRSSVYQNDSATEAWKIFDEDSTTYWHSENSTGYWNTDGTYDGTSELVTGHPGEYVTLQLPTNEKVQLHGIRVFPRGLRGQSSAWSAGAAPKDVVVIGSNNGSSWNVIATTTLTNYSFGTSPSLNTPVGEEYVPATFNFEATEYYQHVGLIIKNLYPGGHVHASMTALEFLGLPEYDPEAHGTDVVIKSVPNVPNTDWLEVYYDAKGLTPGEVTSVSDLKPSSLGTALNSSSTNNITVTDDAFVFNGTDSYIKIDDLTNPSGAWVHSVVAWINPSDLGNFEVTWIGDADSATTRQAFTFTTSGQAVTMGINGSNVQFRLASPLTKNKWHHIAYTFSGGATGSDSTAYRVFIDGVEAYKSTGVNSATLTLPAQTALWIGRNHGGSNYFKGKIANLRLFNRALAIDEIDQLYTYQKGDFGYSTNSMTLKAGRLGIGTSEPKATLDVRGDVQVGGIITSNNPAFSVYRDAGDLTENDTTIVWNQVRFNRGNCYDSSTGIFTPTVDGMYFFTVFGMSDGLSNPVVSFRFEIALPNGVFDTTTTPATNRTSIIHALWPYQFTRSNSGTTHGQASGSFVYYLEAGSRFRVLWHGDELLAHGNSHNGFSGFLIG